MARRSARTRYPFLTSFKSQHGKTRWRFRRHGHVIYLPPPHDPMFDALYADAMLQSADKTYRKAKGRLRMYSVEWCIEQYKLSEQFAVRLKPKTRQDKAAIMKRMVKAWGDMDIRKMTIAGLAADLEELEKVTTRNKVRGIFKQVFAYGIVRDWGGLKVNIVDSIPKSYHVETPTHGWTKAERDQYCERWPSGTKQRLAFELLFGTLQRSSDMVLMGRDNLDGEHIIGKTVKTGSSYRAPMTPSLAAEVEPYRHQDTFLQTHYGIAFTAKGFQQAFADWCDAADLPKKCRGHGLRKAGCQELADSGATITEIMAISSHITLSEVQKYVATAQSRKRAVTAHDKRMKAREE